MQPEVNPNYFRYQYPNYAPGPMYPYGQVQQNYGNNIAGKIVNDFSEITCNDIPMNGQGAIFVKGDLSEIVLKKWESNGTISTMPFKPFVEQNPNNVANDSLKGENDPFKSFLSTFEDQMRVLNEKIDRISRPNKSKKEVNEDE